LIFRPKINKSALAQYAKARDLAGAGNLKGAPLLVFGEKKLTKAAVGCNILS
jgi:hypothetical protein